MDRDELDLMDRVKLALQEEEVKLRGLDGVYLKFRKHLGIFMPHFCSKNLKSSFFLLFFAIFGCMNTNKISESRFPAAGYTEFTNLTTTSYIKVVP